MNHIRIRGIFDLVAILVSGAVWLYFSYELLFTEYPKAGQFGKALLSAAVFSFIVFLAVVYWIATGRRTRDAWYGITMTRKIANELEPFRGNWNDHAFKRFPGGWKGRSGPERILSVMIIDKKDGTVTSVVRPGGHAHCYMWRFHKTGELNPQCREGFFTSYCRFVTREEGLKIAEAAGQIKFKHPSPNQLYSEDMWNPHMLPDKPWDKTE